jgi:hypothetical protein
MGVYYNGMRDALKYIKKTEGWAGFSRGIVPRMIFFSMAAGIQWGTYEYVKYVQKLSDNVRLPLLSHCNQY